MSKSSNAYGKYITMHGKEIKDIKSFRIKNPGAVVFQSILEFRCYKILESSGYKFTWQPESKTLLESFNTWSLSKGKIKKLFKSTVRSISYTPDFLILCPNGQKIYLEVKGFFQPDARIRYKLFQASLKNNEIILLVYSEEELMAILDIIKKSFSNKVEEQKIKRITI